MPRHDIFVGILVALITIVLHNLALAVLIGVIISALVFAWESARNIRVHQHWTETGSKYYEISGPLFFGAVTTFLEQFDVTGDPDEVVIDFKDSRVADMSAIDALNKLTERYAKAGKKLHLKHLSSDCIALLQNAGSEIDVNIVDDPTYRVAVEGVSYKKNAGN
ncbi:STAS domain-containing protein [Chitinophaga sedimenti]|uniref:STAS domain-containing protein n=1 Tax=Chitinophaga sedimenti TaxID=2033606 RepID=UPI002006CC67|nr:STAS domain-containing protein [Chitinophaga sedimenti]MCK7555423.1 STAS domain-containing protein [Chitinophaga sedimenti]